MLSDNPKIAVRIPKGKWTRWYTDKEKLEVVKCYLITGNQTTTAAAYNINKNTMTAWVHSQWFKDLSEQLKREGSIQLSTKLRKIADKALDVALDRLENGEWIYDQKLGEMRRKPIQARDAHKIAVDFLDRADKTEDRVEKSVTDESQASRLQELAQAFTNMANKTSRVEVIDVIAIEKAETE